MENRRNEIQERLQELDYLVEFTTDEDKEYSRLEQELIELDWCIDPVSGRII